MTAPPLAYYGGKTTLAPRIAGMLPPHEHYVEPFCGGLSVLLAKAPSVMETANDLDGRLMTFWRVLRDRPEDLSRVCALTPHSRAEYLACRDIDEDPADDELEVARRVWVRLTQGRSGTQKRTGWRHYVVPRGSSIGMPGYLEAYVDRMTAVATRLAHVSLECLRALDLIAKYGAADGALLYVDPPYLASTRAGLDAARSNYLIDMPAEEDHLELLGALRRCQAAVVLSGYDSELYAEELAGWERHRFHATTNGDATSKVGVRTEVVWSNRPIGHLTLWGDEVQA